MLYISWNVSPEIANLFGILHLRYYGLCFACSFLLGFQIMQYIFKSEKKNTTSLETLMLYLVIGTVVGARLGHVLFYEPRYFLLHPLEILQIWHGGLASHGGGIGVFVAVWLFSRKYRIPFLHMTDRLIIPVALAGFFIRLGNLFNSEIIGKPTDLPWGVLFMRNFEYSQVPRHPSQMYESISCLVLFFIFFFLWANQKSKYSNGFLTGIFLITLFCLRFLYEFTKENQVDFENSLLINMGQLLSVLFIVFGMVLIIYAKTHPKFDDSCKQ